LIVPIGFRYSELITGVEAVPHNQHGFEQGASAGISFKKEYQGRDFERRFQNRDYLNEWIRDLGPHCF
jgi:hypothetical protein